MKTSIIKTAIILMALGFTVNANAAKGGVNVPEKITEEFTAKYPQAKLKDWKIAKAGYKAEFKLNHKKHTAVYASDGTLLKTETKLSWTREMPLAVKTALKKGEYASYHVDEIKEVNAARETQYVLTIDNHGGSTMAAEGYGAWEDYQVVFENNGTLTSVKEL
ncbi:MAG: hypothetical protein JWQ63_3977 [Mucilaginibacter sp.]|nr:hypothetical protein [Mucilaginibacter sp.]